MRLRGKIALVTGAADGIGLAISEAFAREGARVVMADINDKKCAAEAATISDRGPGQALAVHCDVSQSADVEALVLLLPPDSGRARHRLPAAPLSWLSSFPGSWRTHGA